VEFGTGVVKLRDFEEEFREIFGEFEAFFEVLSDFKMLNVELVH